MRIDNFYRQTARWGPWGYALLLLGSAALSQFAVLSNDSFPLRWQAEHLSLSAPSTFYDGFFPIAYPLLLRAAQAIGSPFRVLEFLQILFAILYFTKATRFATSNLDEPSALIALPFLIFAPQLIRAILSAVPDFFAALCVLIAFVSWTDNKDNGRWSGLWLGVGILFRTHVFALAIALTLALLIMERSAALRRTATLWLGVAPFVVLHGIVQTWAGHGFFETGQAFNLWKTMHGVDWSDPPLQFASTLPQVILDEPQLFVRTYIQLVLNQLYLLLPLSLYLGSTMLKGGRPKPLASLSLATIFYLLATVAGGSARALIPILPVVILCVIALFRWVSPSERSSRHGDRLAIILTVSLMGLSVAALFYGAIRARNRMELYQRLQSRLGLVQSDDVRSVYSDDYALYFPALRETAPRRSGGWAEIGLPNYVKENPHIPDSTPTVWYQGLQSHHIRFVALRVPPINPRVASFAEIDTAHFVKTPFSGPYSVYIVR